MNSRIEDSTYNAHEQLLWIHPPILNIHTDTPTLLPALFRTLQISDPPIVCMEYSVDLAPNISNFLRRTVFGSHCDTQS